MTIKTKIILSLLLLAMTSCCDSISRQEVIFRDTLYLSRLDTFTLNGKPTISYKNDTVIMTRPFLAKKDTILKRIYLDRIKYDTISFSYAYPNNDFRLRIGRELDTLKLIHTKIQTTIENEPTFWDKVNKLMSDFFLIFIGIVIGYLLTKLIKSQK